MTNTTTAGRTQRSRLGRLIPELWFQAVLAAVLGIATGILAPGLGEDLKPLNDWFIALVKMIVIPVVFCVVTTGIASMDNLRKAGRIGVKAIGYFLVLSLVSMLIGPVTAQTVALATGVSYRRLAAPGLEALTGYGVVHGSARDRRSMDEPSSPAPARAPLRSRPRALTGPP